MMKTGANNSLTADVKAIKTTFKRKKSVVTLVAHKQLKRFVPSLKQRVPVWGHSRAGTSRALLAFAENLFTADVREIKIVSSIRLRVRGLAIQVDRRLLLVAEQVFVPFLEQRAPVGQLSFSGISTLSLNVANVFITGGVKGMAIDLMTGLPAKGPVFSLASIGMPAINLKSPETATTTESAGIMTLKTRDVIDFITPDVKEMIIISTLLKNVLKDAVHSLLWRLSYRSNTSKVNTVSNPTIPVPVFRMRFDGSMIGLMASAKSSSTGDVMAMKINLSLAAIVRPSVGTLRTSANCKFS
jgi:hypothetical protein